MKPDSSYPALLVLAAGMGSRYGGLKQIDPVGPGGETVLDYSVYDALRAGFRKIVFVIRREFEADFRARVGRRFESRTDVRYVFQEISQLPAGHRVPAAREKPWGTGHAVWCAAGELAGPFAVINADDFYGVDSFRRLGGFLSAVRAPHEFCMIGFRLVNTLSEHGTVSRGVCQVDRGRLTGVTECTVIERTPTGARQVEPDGAVRAFTGEEIVSMNCWGFTPALFPALTAQLDAFLCRRGAEMKSEFYLPTAVAEMISRDGVRVNVLPTPGSWFGVTYQNDRPLVTAALRRRVEAGEYPERLWD